MYVPEYQLTGTSYFMEFLLVAWQLVSDKKWSGMLLSVKQCRRSLSCGEAGGEFWTEKG